MPRRHQPAVEPIGIGGEFGLQRLEIFLERRQLGVRDLVVAVHVREHPRLRQIRQRLLPLHRDHGQRQAAIVAGEFPFREHQQGEPGTQPVAIGTRGRVAPRKVLVVELHEREVVGLEVDDAQPGLGAHDHVPMHTDDVAGPDQREFLLRERRAIQRDTHRHERTLIGRRRAAEHVCLADLRGETLAQPGLELVARDFVGHALTASYFATTCSSPASSGSPCTRLR